MNRLITILVTAVTVFAIGQAIVHAQAQPATGTTDNTGNTGKAGYNGPGAR